MWTVQIIDKFANRPLNAYINKDHKLVYGLTESNYSDALTFDKIGDCMKFCVELMERQFEPEFDDCPEFIAKVFRI